MIALNLTESYQIALNLTKTHQINQTLQPALLSPTTFAFPAKHQTDPAWNFYQSDCVKSMRYSFHRGSWSSFEMDLLMCDCFCCFLCELFLQLEVYYCWVALAIGSWFRFLLSSRLCRLNWEKRCVGGRLSIKFALEMERTNKATMREKGSKKSEKETKTGENGLFWKIQNFHPNSAYSVTFSGG